MRFKCHWGHKINGFANSCLFSLPWRTVPGNSRGGFFFLSRQLLDSRLRFLEVCVIAGLVFIVKADLLTFLITVMVFKSVTWSSNVTFIFLRWHFWVIKLMAPLVPHGVLTAVFFDVLRFSLPLMSFQNFRIYYGFRSLGITLTFFLYFKCLSIYFSILYVSAASCFFFLCVCVCVWACACALLGHFNR